MTKLYGARCPVPDASWGTLILTVEEDLFMDFGKYTADVHKVRSHLPPGFLGATFDKRPTQPALRLYKPQDLTGWPKDGQWVEVDRRAMVQTKVWFPHYVSWLVTSVQVQIIFTLTDPKPTTFRSTPISAARIRALTAPLLGRLGDAGIVGKLDTPPTDPSVYEIWAEVEGQLRNRTVEVYEPRLTHERDECGLWVKMPDGSRVPLSRIISGASWYAR